MIELNEIKKENSGIINTKEDRREAKPSFTSKTSKQVKPDEIEESLHTAKSYLDQGEISFFHAECKLIIIRLKQFNDLEYPTIRNIL